MPNLQLMEQEFYNWIRSKKTLTEDIQVVRGKMLLPKTLYWTRIINLIIQQYLWETTVCILWNGDIEFDLDTSTKSMYTIVNIKRGELAESFGADVVDYSEKRKELVENGVFFDDLVEKLTMSIEKSHCESFLAFEADIPIFVEAFNNASKYSIWRSIRNRYVFAFDKTVASGRNYFQHYFFEEQTSILVIEGDANNFSTFELKTNKYVGPRAQHPEQLYVLDRFDPTTGRFDIGANLFPDKTKNLQGREVVMSIFDYRPYIVLEHTPGGYFRDLAFENETDGAAEIDGTEIRVVLTFCEKYNCTLQIDTSGADDWGVVYANFSGEGALGMIAKRKTELSVGAMYAWYVDYLYLDMSMYLVRSGITCLVPAPRRLASWMLPVQPFQWNLWMAVLACLSMEAAGLMLMHRFHESRSWWKSLAFGLSTTLKIFLSQAGKTYKKMVSLRVLLCACFLIDIVVTSIYGGGLASILTIPSFGEAADSLDRLHSTGLKWGASSSAWVLAITNTDDTRINDILKNFVVYTEDELSKLALKQEFAVTLERLPFGHFAIGDFLTSEAVSHMKIMQDDIYFQYTVAFATRLWPLLERYDNLIYIWHSSGFDKFWEWRIVADNLNGHIQKQVEATMYSNLENLGPLELGMANFAGILLIWIMGITIAIVVFLGELLLQRLRPDVKVNKII